MNPNNGDHIYFLGIGGTGMASVAGLAQQAGFKVTGSDANLYPPMSTMLEELNIEVKTPYSEDNLKSIDPDIVVVANALSRGNGELEAVLAKNLNYTSFPKLLGDLFLKNRSSVVVSGTHGKTTTTSILTWILESLGESPGYMIGGIPKNFTHSFNLGKGAPFIVEGDEYDTAFFDKGPKFLHYHPKYLILNNLEFDHADIFKDLAAIEHLFKKLVNLVPEPKNILANIDDPGVQKILNELGIMEKVTQVSTLGKSTTADIAVTEVSAAGNTSGAQIWKACISTKTWGNLSIETNLSGAHNIANISQAIACLERLYLTGKIERELSVDGIKKAINTFDGVSRRLEHINTVNNIDIYEDFAHHPTAVKLVIEGFRKAYPNKRLIVAFDPRNATSRRNIFLERYAKELSAADIVFIGQCTTDKRIPENERMDTTELAKRMTSISSAYDDNEDPLKSLASECKPGDSVIFMSSGSFSNIQHKLADIILDNQT